MASGPPKGKPDDAGSAEDPASSERSPPWHRSELQDGCGGFAIGGPTPRRGANQTMVRVWRIRRQVGEARRDDRPDDRTGIADLPQVGQRTTDGQTGRWWECGGSDARWAQARRDDGPDDRTDVEDLPEAGQRPTGANWTMVGVWRIQRSMGAARRDDEPDVRNVVEDLP